MLPFERLRSLARYAGDARGILDETAECLAEFEHDPVQLVLVCRRLLAHHPSNGPLWWLCAHVVSAANPGAAARDAIRASDADRTADRLAAVLPFPHDDPVAVLGWPPTAGSALTQRPDLDVAVVRPDRPDAGLRRRLGNAGRPVRMVDSTEVMAIGASHLLVEVLAASPTQALVPPGTSDLRWALPDAALWLVAPLDHILPERLFAAAAGQAGDTVETMAIEEAAAVAGPGGLDSAERFVTRLDCPLAPELLKL